MFNTYADLQAEIANTLHRDNLGNNISMFIKMFEAVANRELKTLQQEVITNLTLSGGSNTVTLPTNFVELVMVSLNGCKLDPLDNMTFASQSYQNTGQPSYYSLIGGNIVTDTVADQSYTVSVRYFKKWDLEAEGTNWLLQNYPDLYLYGSLSASSFFIDDDRSPLWTELSRNAMDKANISASQSRRKILVTDFPSDASVDGYFDIRHGY